MRQLTYLAILEPSTDGYGIFFPDFPGCISFGKDIINSKEMASEALSLHVYGMEKDNEEIPSPSKPPFTDMEQGMFVMPVTIYPDLFKSGFESKAVKKTLTIPYWLDELAKVNNLNFSQVLQDALKQRLDVYDSPQA